MSKRKDVEAAMTTILGDDTVDPSVMLRMMLVASQAHDAGKVAGLREAADMAKDRGWLGYKGIRQRARELAKKARAK